MHSQNNPAGRLGGILRAAKTHGGQNKAAKAVWAEILEIEPIRIDTT
jgi:hypothetical protein